MLAISAVIISILCYVYIGFYDYDEIAFFVKRFGVIIIVPIGFLTTSLFLCMVSINLRSFLVYGSIVWYWTIATTVIGTVTSIVVYPMMDLSLREVRTANKDLPQAVAVN